MSRVCKRKPSVCTDQPLSNDEICNKVAVMRRALTSCYGPRGRLKQIHNAVGGQVQTTSTSGVLLRAMTLSEPLLRLIAAAVLDHTARLSDCGLFTGSYSSVTSRASYTPVWCHPLYIISHTRSSSITSCLIHYL